MSQGSVPSVSVVMPAYNAEKYLREAIDSILAQTFTDFEFIIINDGSTDRTKEIILSYSDPRIVYLENEVNSGICVTLNKGLDAARGRYIARMDSDDISLPERLDVQVRYMDSHPDIGVVGSDIEVFGEGIEPYLLTQLHTPEECVAGLLFNSCFAHPSVMIRKNILNKHNLRYKEEFRGLEDYELWWQIGKYTLLNNLAMPLLRYRHHNGQETQNVPERVRESFLVFIKDRFRDLNIYISDDELRTWNAYAVGDFSHFDDDSVCQFIEVAKRMIKYYPKSSYRVRNALKLTLAKGITYALHNSTQIKGNHQKYFNRYLASGIFPLIWYIKVTYHNLFR